MHFEYRNISIEGANNHRLPLPVIHYAFFFLLYTFTGAFSNGGSTHTAAIKSAPKGRKEE